MPENPKNSPIPETLYHAQADMRESYANGSTGIIVSGLIWLTAAIVAFLISDKHAIWTLLVGGMFIYPIGLLLDKVIGLKSSHTSRNPLGNLAMEGTVLMLMCLPLAYGLSLQQSAWFFQAMMVIIGGRYLTFATIYGNRIYWLLGGVLGIAAYLLFGFQINASGSALTGSLIEIAFGIFMFIRFRKNQQELKRIRHRDI